MQLREYLGVERMLNNKKFNVLLAFLIAIALWLYVVGDVNPVIKVTVRDVPITYINQEKLAQNDRVLLKSSDDNVDISISGPRATVTRMSKGDFQVIADVEGLKLGDNTIRIDAKGPDSAKIESLSIDKIIVTIDEKVTETKDVKVHFAGEVGEDKEPHAVELSAESVTVSGAKTLIQKVDHVDATIDVKNIGEELKTINAQLVAVDKNGKEITPVDIYNKQISVAAVMLSKKTVSLEVPILNADDDTYEKDVAFPKTIVIKGKESELSKINSISCKAVDLKNITEDTTIKLEPVLPSGISVSDDVGDLILSVKVKDLKKVSFKIDSKDIISKNIGDGLQAEVQTESISVDIFAKEADIKNIAESDVSVSCDLSGLKAGTHNVKISIECSKPHVSIKPSVEEIRIIIK